MPSPAQLGLLTKYVRHQAMPAEVYACSFCRAVGGGVAGPDAIRFGPTCVP